MEGVCDAPMRKILTRHGGYDECFSEFIRVSDVVLPKKALVRSVPELEQGCTTDSGAPVRVQLLGDNPNLIAKTAKVAESLGASSIDLNFGCPSRFVHHAGAMLLKEPALMHEIVSRTREILDPKTHLSVKMRLGFADKSEALGIVQEIAVDGVNEIIIHARTRKDLYRQDALDWSAIASLHEPARRALLVANGEIHSWEDAQTCARLSGCDIMMTGRGALMVPNLGHVIKDNAAPTANPGILAVLLEFMQELMQRGFAEKSVLDRSKQFLGFARRFNPSLGEFFKLFCQINALEESLKLVGSSACDLGAGS